MSHWVSNTQNFTELKVVWSFCYKYRFALKIITFSLVQTCSETVQSSSLSLKRRESQLDSALPFFSGKKPLLEKQIQPSNRLHVCSLYAIYTCVRTTFQLGKQVCFALSDIHFDCFPFSVFHSKRNKHNEIEKKSIGAKLDLYRSRLSREKMKERELNFYAI